ncbi:HlyD family efflux transporter periplasmic adaptor subunit [Xanthomonas sp. MUS 060]|uniref:HlyD family secretion protein n=1 Tax=Xanthomonas sp. MUS 060 TaxID=1588031 RepID=UPI0005F2BE72|nr:HlyD family efflux transporter periplasmic adaptor subunit [Xanthomonas sp. MUS 060]
MKAFAIAPLLSLLLVACAPSDRASETTSASASPPAYLAVARGRIDVEGGVLKLGLPVSATLREVAVHEGDAVQRGALLVAADDRAAALALDIAHTHAQAAATHVHQLQQRLGHVQQHQRRLAEAARLGAGDEQSADDASDAVQSLDDELQNARSDAALADAQVRAAELQRAQYQLHAPVAGRVLQLSAAVGTRSEANTPLLTLLPDAPRLVRAELNESYAGSVAPGMSAEIISDDGRQSILGEAVVRWLAPAYGHTQLHDDTAPAGNDRSVGCVLAFTQPSTLRLGQRVLVRFRNPAATQRH